MAENSCDDRENDNDRLSPKRRKLDGEKDTVDDASTVHETEPSLSTFKLARVLQNNCTRKLICVEGTFEDDENPAIVLLERKSFPNDELYLKKSVFNDNTVFRKVFTNDVYGNYDCFPTTEYSGLRATVIHPATSSHLEKYRKQEMYIVDETYELYNRITLPYIQSTSLRINWITNILEHKAEQENIVYESPDRDNGFVLVTDFKWDKQPDTLKLLALPFQHIRSLRELDGSHLPLLRNIRDAGIAAISKKFNIPGSQLRIYFHYQPSYYYLHVHFCYLMFEAPGIHAGKAHLLSTVIRNLELMPDYYTKATLSYTVYKGSPLYEKFKSDGVLQDTVTSSDT